MFWGIDYSQICLKQCGRDFATLHGSMCCIDYTLFISFHGLEPEAYLQVNVAVYWNTLEPVAQIDAEKQNRAQIEFCDLHLFLLFNMVKTLKVNSDFWLNLLRKTHFRSCQHN